MACIHPYYKTLDDGTVVPCPCGKCLYCLQRYQSDWSVRLKEETKAARSAFFVTLTYDENNLPMLAKGTEVQGILIKAHVQKFIKRVRKEVADVKLRYFAVGEYGGKGGRPHYHLILFGLPCVSLSQCLQLVERHWRKGFCYVEWVTPQNIKYLCKYMNKLDERPWFFPPFRLMSQGIGRAFVDNPKIWKWYQKLPKLYYHDGEYRKHLPRYYYDKFYPKEIVTAATDFTQGWLLPHPARFWLQRDCAKRSREKRDKWNKEHPDEVWEIQHKFISDTVLDKVKIKNDLKK